MGFANLVPTKVAVATKRECRGDEHWFALPWWHGGARVINSGGVGVVSTLTAQLQ